MVGFKALNGFKTLDSRVRGNDRENIIITGINKRMKAERLAVYADKALELEYYYWNIIIGDSK